MITPPSKEIMLPTRQMRKSGGQPRLRFRTLPPQETVEDRVAKQKEDSISPFYVQPNSDADLEKFMATYGVDSDSSDDDVDYSKYLDAIEKKTGGDNR